MATHSSILSWRIPWTEEPGRLQSMRSQRFSHDWSDLAHSSLGCDKMQRKYRCTVGVDWTSLHLSSVQRPMLADHTPAHPIMETATLAPCCPRPWQPIWGQSLLAATWKVYPIIWISPLFMLLGMQWAQEHTESQGFRVGATHSFSGEKLSLSISKGWSTISTHCQTAPHNAILPFLPVTDGVCRTGWLISLSLTHSLSLFLCVSFSDR